MNFTKNNVGYNKIDTLNEATDGKLVSFIKQTYQLFAASLLGGAVGAYVGIPFSGFISSYFIAFLILEIGLLVGLMFAKHTKGLNLVLMFSFVFMTGFTAAPLLSSVLSMSGGATVIGNAFAMTSFIVGAMSYFAIKTTQDFRSFQKPMFIAILVIFGFSLLNMFLFESSFLSVIISAVVVLVFTFMVVIDTQNIVNGSYETPIDGAIALYLDFINIFMSLLNLLSASKE